MRETHAGGIGTTRKLYATTGGNEHGDRRPGPEMTRTEGRAVTATEGIALVTLEDDRHRGLAHAGDTTPQARGTPGSVVAHHHGNAERTASTGNTRGSARYTIRQKVGAQ